MRRTLSSFSALAKQRQPRVDEVVHFKKWLDGIGLTLPPPRRYCYYFLYFEGIEQLDFWGIWWFFARSRYSWSSTRSILSPIKSTLLKKEDIHFYKISTQSRDNVSLREVDPHWHQGWIFFTSLNLEAHLKSFPKALANLQGLIENVSYQIDQFKLLALILKDQWSKN